MCVYVCEQLVLPESLLNYLKHAFRILTIMLLSLPFGHFLAFSPKTQHLPGMTVDVLPWTVFKENSVSPLEKRKSRLMAQICMLLLFYN